MLNSSQLFFVIIASIVTFIGIFVITLCMYYFYNYIKLSKNEECCQQRHPYFIDLLGIINIIMNIIVPFIRIFYVTKPETSLQMQILSGQIGVAIAIVMVIKYTQHVFEIYYETEISKTLHNQTWKTLINNTVKDNWFINNKNKYGNKRFLNKIAFIWIMSYVLLTIPSRIVTYILDSNNDSNGVLSVILLVIYGVIIIEVLVPILFMCYLYYKIRGFNDVFRIIYQFKRNAGAALIGFLMWAAVFVVLRNLNDNTSLFYYSMDCVLSLLSWIPFAIITYNDTFWVIKNVINADKISKQKNIKVTLQNVLTNDTAINIFMNHLSQEFSMELLLCYLECNQYKTYVKNTLNIPIETQLIQFPDTVPISHIITKYDTDPNITDPYIKIKYIASELYNKYVRIGSEYEININYHSRNKLINLIHDNNSFLNRDVNDTQLLYLFDDCIKETLLLLGYSLSRAFGLQSMYSQFEIALTNNDT